MESTKAKEMQSVQLKKALGHPVDQKLAKGELSDDALDQVAGGAVLNSVFYIAKCGLCGWQSAPFDNQGEYDLNTIVFDHIQRCPSCSGDFSVYCFDSRSLMLG